VHSTLRLLRRPYNRLYMERRAAIALGILLACCNIACALNPSLDINQYAHTAWTVRDGFFKGTVGSIAQTPDGYLWLGTEFGLFRFDGVRAVPWQAPADEHLPGSNIRRLLVSRDGRLWIGTNQGLASLKDGKLTRYPALDGQDVPALLEDHEGTVWVGGWATSTGRLCAIQSGKSKCYGEDGSLGPGVFSLYEDRAGNLWAGGISRLWRWKPGSPKLYPITKPGAEIAALIEGENGALLIGMSGGMRQLIDGEVRPSPLPGVDQFTPDGLLRDRDGSLWIATIDRGLVHLHQGRVDLFTRADGLSGDYVLSIFQDREGDIWIATIDGLDRFRDFAIPTISVKQGLSNATVESVLAARDGSIWLGTFDGLNRWKDGKITTYRRQNSGLPADSAHSLFEDDGGRIWVSTIRGVAYLDHGRFIPVSDVPGGIVHSIVGDGEGNLWINHQNQGLLHLVQGRVVQRVSRADLQRKDIADTLIPDPSQGGMWVGFFRSGIAYVKDGRVRASFGVVDGLGSGIVSDFTFDTNGTLWAATQGGLSRLKNGRVTTLTSRNGLPCDVVNWMVEDDAGSFWLGTACGLVRISRPEMESWAKDPKRAIQTTVFDGSDGVKSHGNTSAYSPRVAKSRDGKIWFLPFDGVSVVDPGHLPFNKLPPPVHIEQITADRKTYETSSNLRLPPLVRDLEVDYTALSLVAPEKNRFRYKLEGRDRDWLDAGTRRQAFYSDLPPRNYRFRVVASNNSGVWNEAGASFDFSIAPAYYQTSWFRASCGVAFLALLWGLYRYRLHQIAREFNVRLEERVGERTRIARDLHDTLLQSFQGLMLHLQVVDDLLPQGKAKDELEKTLDRADQAIAEGRSAVHDLRSSTTTTNDLAEAVRAVGNELAAPGVTAFRLVVEGPSRDLHPIIRDEIYRVAREALRNAFSHAQANHVEAELIYGDRLFCLRIRDDGQGIAPEFLEEGRAGHYGLPGMRERAKQIGAKLIIWSGEGRGTEIELNLEGSIAYGMQPGGSRLRLFRKKAV
jgi:signal transduction histidine kinase/ligand-binding sensor domain-containing protein